MNKKILSGLILFLLAGETNAASGVYVSAKAGAGMLRSTGSTLQGSATVGALQNTLGSTELNTQSQTHFSPSLAVGYDFSDRYDQPVRLELAFSTGGEISGMETSSGSVVSTWSGSSGTTGYRESFKADVYRKQKTELSTLMVNGYYDYRSDSSFTPWVMGGVGIAFIHSTMSGGGGAQGIVVNSENVSRRLSQVAWAAGAGITWTITQHFAFDAGYRFTNAGDVNLSGEGASGIVAGSGETRTRLLQHTIEAGLRYTF